VVKVGWFLAEQDPHELLLLSYRVGRWNLLVIPPSTPAASAAWLMAAGSDPLGTSTASRLVAEAENLRTAAKDDRASEAVWNSEGGHLADPARRPQRIAAFRYGHPGPAVPGPGSPAPRRARGRDGASGIGTSGNR
jgi:hypothetical protein